jgi:uncharacterized spore protein YtfJ
MANELGEVALLGKESHDKSVELLEKLTETARPEAVFSKPVKVGDVQVITASEVHVGLGFGFGFGGGPHFVSNLDDEQKELEETTGSGSGGGGGGGAGARPVAVITVHENGVNVEPIFDSTKIALAFITMLGSVFFFGAQMKKGKK